MALFSCVPIFVGFKIRCHCIFFHNTYRKLPFMGTGICGKLVPHKILAIHSISFWQNGIHEWGKLWNIKTNTAHHLPESISPPYLQWYLEDPDMTHDPPFTQRYEHPPFFLASVRIVGSVVNWEVVTADDPLPGSLAMPATNVLLVSWMVSIISMLYAATPLEIWCYVSWSNLHISFAFTRYNINWVFFTK